MVNVLDAISGRTLEYGVSMDSEKMLQDWIDGHQLKENLQKAIKEHQGEFLVLGDAYQDFANEVSVASGDLANLQTFLNNVSSSTHCFTWHKESHKLMTKVGELMNQQQNERLLGLALSSKFYKPLRYCIQAEIKPSVNYWKVHTQNVHGAQNSVTIVVVDSSSPILAISRVVPSLLTKGRNVILVPGSDLTLLSCVIMGGIINKAGIPCAVYSINPEKLSELSNLSLDIVFCGGYAKSLTYRASVANVLFDAEGKKVVVAHETADCDAAVDACLFALKTSSRTSPGIYLIVQDLLYEDIEWRLRDRMTSCKTGSYLDSLVDFPNDSPPKNPPEISQFLEQTELNTIKAGDATIVFNAQPSMPITQVDRLGQTLLVFSYRSFPELINILNNLKGVTDLSLWLEQQSLAWHIVNQVQIRCISLNAPFGNDPVNNELMTIQKGKLTFAKSLGVKANSSLFANFDALRAAQRTWMSQAGKSAKLHKLLQVLALETPFADHADTLREAEKSALNRRGEIVESIDKSLMRFELVDSLGAIAIISNNSRLTGSFIRLVIRSLAAGNGVVLCTNSELSALAQSFVRAAKSAGLPDVVFACESNTENHSAIVKHHGIGYLVVFGDVVLPGPVGSHVKGVWQTASEDFDELLDYMSPHKHVAMAIGDGLGN